MTCRDVEARITAYLDGELDATTSSALRGHLRTCAACQALAEDHQRIASTLAHLPPAQPPPGMWDGVMAKLAEAEKADARRSRFGLWGTRFWERLRPQLMPLTAVAAAAVVAVVWIARPTGPNGDEAAPAPAPTSTIRAVTPPIADTAPSPARPARVDRVDVEAALVAELERVDRLYQETVADLLEVAREERATWSAARQRTFDGELAALRHAVAARPLAIARADAADPFAAAEEAAAAREKRERAWQALVGFLQRTALGERVAEAW